MNALDITTMSDVGLDALLANAGRGMKEAASAATKAEIMAPDFADEIGSERLSRLTYEDMSAAIDAAMARTEYRAWMATWAAEIEDDWREANGYATVHR